MDWQDRIVTTSDTLFGRPRIAGTRIGVELILDLLAQGWTYEMLLESYPHITRDDILACLAFAAEMMRDKPYVAIDKVAV